MSGHNRHLRGATNDVMMPVHGSVVIEPGDLVIINSVRGSCGNASTTLWQEDNYVFPLSYCRTATAGSQFDMQLQTTFMGVAMSGSISGITNNIRVASSGIFRYPLNHISAVTVGSRVFSPTPAGGVLAGGGSVQAVAAAGSQAAGDGSSAALGVIVKTESGASFVDFQLMTRMSGGSIA